MTYILITMTYYVTKKRASIFILCFGYCKEMPCMLAYNIKYASAAYSGNIDLKKE